MAIHVLILALGCVGNRLRCNIELKADYEVGIEAQGNG